MFPKRIDTVIPDRHFEELNWCKVFFEESLHQLYSLIVLLKKKTLKIFLSYKDCSELMVCLTLHVQQGKVKNIWLPRENFLNKHETISPKTNNTKCSAKESNRQSGTQVFLGHCIYGKCFSRHRTISLVWVQFNCCCFFFDSYLTKAI